MISIYQIKPAFQRLLQPILKALIAAGVTPNQVTWAALVLSVLGGLLLAIVPISWVLAVSTTWVLLLLPVILLVRMALNALDGMLARTQGLSTPLGEILNELGDVLADIALYAPLAMFAPSWEGSAVILLFVLLAVMSEFCGLLGKVVSGQRRYDGPLGKSDRAFVISLYAFCLYFIPEATHRYTVAGFGALNALLLLTCWNRLGSALKAANKETPA